jgi:hypothetical protein
MWAVDQATRRNTSLGKRREQARAPLLPTQQLGEGVQVALMGGVYEETSRSVTMMHS